MSLKIISEKVNQIIGRKEVTAEVSFSGPTPKKEDIKNMISSKIGSEPSLVAIRVIDNIYGEQKAKVVAMIYNDAATMSKLETTAKRKKTTASSEDGKKEGA